MEGNRAEQLFLAALRADRGHDQYARVAIEHLDHAVLLRISVIVTAHFAKA